MCVLLGRGDVRLYVVTDCNYDLLIDLTDVLFFWMWPLEQLKIHEIHQNGGKLLPHSSFVAVRFSSQSIRFSRLWIKMIHSEGLKSWFTLFILMNVEHIGSFNPNIKCPDLPII